MSVHFPFRVCTFLFWSFFPRYNNCSPFFYLSKCVEIMWFGFVFIEKNAKNKKKRGAFQYLLPHISTTGAPQNIIQTDLGSYSAGLQDLFITFLGNWSCDHSPDDPLDGPWQQPMKMPGAMKSGQWKGLACNEKYPMKILRSNEKLPMRYPGLQWKVLNEKARSNEK